MVALIEAVRRLFNPRFTAGHRAERAFERLAAERGWVLEPIPQDRATFRKYAGASAVGVKRGDYLVRNLGNVEVDVKCFTVYDYGEPGYLIEYAHVKRHEAMEQMTGSPVVFAVFERSGRSPVEGSLRMIPLSELVGRERAPDVEYIRARKCLHVPVWTMYPGFDLFDHIRAHGGVLGDGRIW